MLQRILEVLRTSDTTLTVADLARTLDVPVSAVGPMVGLLVRTGMLKQSGTIMPAATCDMSCGSTCMPDQCPFVIGLPTTLELVSQHQSE